jgi:hypothetical protein
VHQFVDTEMWELIFDSTCVMEDLSITDFDHWQWLSIEFIDGSASGLIMR